MKKRMLAIATALVLICGSFSGCGKEAEKQPEKETVELILKVPTLAMTSVCDPEITVAYDFLSKAAADFEANYTDHDVHIDIRKFELTNETSAITGSYDTDNAVDILYEGYFNMATYIHGGRVVPLDDIITDKIRGDIDESYWEMSSVGGKTYMMPFLSLQNILLYNKELFRSAGLEEFISDENIIQSWSLDEWEQILDALAENLPENHFPMMMYGKNDQGDTHMMVLLRSQGSQFFDGEGNFNLDTDQGKAALQWIVNGKEKGWYPPSCENLEITDMVQLFTNGQLAIVTSNNASIPENYGINAGYVNFPSQDGTGLSTSFVTGFEVFDNGDETKVKVAKDFVKYIYEHEQWLDYEAGGIPANGSVSGRYKDQLFMLEEFSKNSANAVDFTANAPNWRGVRDVFYTHIRDLLMGQSPDDVARGIDEDCNAAIRSGREQSVLHE